MAVVAATSGLAYALIDLGDLGRAAQPADRGVAAARAIASPRLADSLAIAALVALARGDRAAARRLLADAHAAGDGPRLRYRLALAEGDLARAGGDCATARASYARAIEQGTRTGEELVVTRAAAGLAACARPGVEARQAVAALAARVQRMEAVGAEPVALAGARAVLARAQAAR